MRAAPRTCFPSLCLVPGESEAPWDGRVAWGPRLAPSGSRLRKPMMILRFATSPLHSPDPPCGRSLLSRAHGDADWRHAHRSTDGERPSDLMVRQRVMISPPSCTKRLGQQECSSRVALTLRCRPPPVLLRPPPKPSPPSRDACARLPDAEPLRQPTASHVMKLPPGEATTRRFTLPWRVGVLLMQTPLPSQSSPRRAR